MERLRSGAELYPDVANNIALIALVDTLFDESDAGAFKILNKILEEIRNE